jgi:hypothetical protein
MLLYLAFILNQNTIFNIFENNNAITFLNAQAHGKNPTLAERIEAFNNEWRSKNSHCYNFGVYSFNFTKWKTLDSSELRVWCNSTNNVQRRYLAGYVKHSNLIILIVEDEFELIHCGNMSNLIDTLYGVNKNQTFQNENFSSNSSNNFSNQNDSSLDISKNQNFANDYPLNNFQQSQFLANDTNNTNSSISNNNFKNNFLINRYRKKPDQCFNYFENEKEYLPCLNSASLIFISFNYFSLAWLFIFINLFFNIYNFIF